MTTYVPLDPFIDGLRQTADYLNDAVFSDDIAAMRDALELGRNKLRQAAEALEEAENERKTALNDAILHLRRMRYKASDSYKIHCPQCKHVFIGQISYDLLTGLD